MPFMFSTALTCKGDFPQQILDLWCNPQFVQVQAETNRDKHKTLGLKAIRSLNNKEY